MRIEIKVTPQAKRNAVEGSPAGGDGVFRVYTTRAPEKGKANDAVVKLLAKHFGVPKSAITIVRGHTSRTKLVEVEEYQVRQQRTS